jgi:hypothetical protein
MGTTETTRRTRTEPTTSVTDLACVIRLDLNNFNSFHFCFVFNKTLQLKERPVANPIIELLPSSDFSYSFEVFHNNLVSVEFGNNVFTDVVINPSHITSFSSANLLKKTLGGASAFGLKNRTQIFEFSFGLLDFGGIVKPAVACDGKIVYSKVNTKNSILETRAADIDLFRESEEKKCSALLINSQEALADFPVKVFFITLGNIKFELLPFFEQSQNQNITLEIGTSWKVVSNRSVVDNWLGFSLLDNSARLPNTSNCKLCWQGFPEMFIDERVKLNIIPNPSFPGSINAELQGFGVSLDSFYYFGSCRNFDFSCCSYLHANKGAKQVYFKSYARMSSANLGKVTIPLRNKIA